MSTTNGYMLQVLLLCLFYLDLTASHPQCLDFRAPFQPNKTLTFCASYSDLGCCGPGDDQKIQESFEKIRLLTGNETWTHCQKYVKDLLCQTCSPYAAHIYDAEGTSRARKFPGLCGGYCGDFYERCTDVVGLLDPALAVPAVLATKDRFCKQVAITDAIYCYPDLLTRPLLLRNLTFFQNHSAASGCLCLQNLNGELSNPLLARHAGDGTGRLFVAEQKGRVRIYNTLTKKWKKTCFLDFTNKTEVDFAGDERGFLGLAFHPNYSKNGRFFVYYSTSRKPGDVLPPELNDRDFSFELKIVISELRVSNFNPNKANRTYERKLLEVFKPYYNHNGGELMFGIDGYLYAFIGDGGGGGDPMKAGQDKSLLLGKVIRIDVDSDPTKLYTIPPDNPFVGEVGSRPEIYAYGIRNTWRCGLDRGGESRGRILCGDVGQNAYEEINVLKKGANYGWNAREGFECYDNQLCGHIGQEELPIHAYNHTIGQSVIGGVFYRGCENPALVGQYLYGDYVSSRLFSLSEANGIWTNTDVHLCGSTMCQGGLVGSLSDHILSFGEDEDGEIYMLTSASSSSSKCDGKVYKIVDPIRKSHKKPSSTSVQKLNTDDNKKGTKSREKKDEKVDTEVRCLLRYEIPWGVVHSYTLQLDYQGKTGYLVECLE